MNTSILKQDRVTDIQVLLFIWNWKVVSISFVSIHFFGTELKKSGYRKMFRLLKNRFIEKVHHHNLDAIEESSYYSITKLGLKCIKPHLPDLRADGSKSEAPLHDLALSASHYWLASLCDQNKISIFTEAELRNYSHEAYPEPFPQTDYHRPDGYLALKNKNNAQELIAIEFERSLRVLTKYSILDSFYSRIVSVDKVIWICNPESRGRKVTEELKNIHSSILAKSYFYSLDELKNKGADATTIKGTPNSTTITELLCQNGGKTPATLTLSRLLCGWKTPFISKAYRKNYSSLKSHCS